MPHQVTVTEAVIIPLAQSVITGGFIGLTVGTVAALASTENPVIAGAAAGSIVSTVTWLGLRAGWERRLESVLGIADQGQQGQQAVYPQSVRVEVISEAGRAGDYLQLPGGADRLRELARGLASGKPLTVRAWCGRSGLYSGSEFDQLRGELIARGLARWRSGRDNRGGAELTAKGLATMRGLASHPPTGQQGLKLERIS